MEISLWENVKHLSGVVYMRVYVNSIITNQYSHSLVLIKKFNNSEECEKIAANQLNTGGGQGF